MKKLLILFLSLALCLTQTACADSEPISGEVVEVTSTALILQTGDGKRVAAVLDGNTHISGFDGIDGTDYKTAPHAGVRISFTPAARAGSVVAADGTNVTAYRTPLIQIDAIYNPEAAILSDGTVLGAWQTALGYTTYYTQKGVELLLEYIFITPENRHTSYTDGIEDLVDGAWLLVADHYENLGKLYDLQAELERAWAAYQADAAAFSPFYVQQETSFAGFSEQVVYFCTNLSQTLSGINAQTTASCAAFDRETGENIPLADLFLSPEDLGKNLLDLAAKDGTGPAEPALTAEMEEAFRLEYLTISQDGLTISFPQGSLPSQEYNYVVTVKYSDECKSLLHPWAIPQSIE